LVGLVTVFESLFNAAAVFGKSTDAFAGTVDVADVFCLELNLAPVAATGFAVLVSTFLISFDTLPATLFVGAAGLFGKALPPVNLTACLAEALAFLTVTGAAALTILFAAGFTFAVTDFAAPLVATGALLFGAAALLATTFTDPFEATFETGLAAAFTGAFAVGLAGLVAGFAAPLDADFIAGLAGLVELLVVVIFEADPNFRLAAFFSVALDFVKIFFALDATGGFAGFFMFSH
jgi:hypothetical protein